MLFDAWIANEDRHDENIWYNYYDDQFFLIDHGNSLFCSLGESNLTNNVSRLAVKTSVPSLSQHIESFADFAYWYEGIKAIPSEAIRRILRNAAEVGVGLALADKATEWLIKRRLLLPSLFQSSLSTFPKVKKTLFDPFGDYHDTFPEYSI